MISMVHPVALIATVGGLLAIGAFVTAYASRGKVVRTLLYGLSLVLATISVGILTMMFYPQLTTAHTVVTTETPPPA